MHDLLIWAIVIALALAWGAGCLYVIHVWSIERELPEWERQRRRRR